MLLLLVSQTHNCVDHS